MSNVKITGGVLQEALKIVSSEQGNYPGDWVTTIPGEPVDISPDASWLDALADKINELVEKERPVPMKRIFEKAVYYGEGKMSWDAEADALSRMNADEFLHGRNIIGMAMADGLETPKGSRVIITLFTECLVPINGDSDGN